MNGGLADARCGWFPAKLRCDADGFARRERAVRVVGQGDKWRFGDRLAQLAMSAPSQTSGFHERGYFPSLDGLRAISIVPVVWHHCTPHPYEGLLGRGAVGVDLFFAISGFLITTLLHRERTSVHGIDLLGFYVRRSARIFPLYFLVLALNVIYAVWIRPDWAPSQRFLKLLPFHATYTANWVKGEAWAGPALFVFAWSLCTEEQFYAFWAPLMKTARRLSWAAWTMGLWLLVDILLETNAVATAALLPSELRTIVTSFATPIGFGALLALLVHSGSFGGQVLRLAAQPWLAIATPAAILCLLVRPWGSVVLLHALLALWVLVCAVPERHSLSPVLCHSALRYLGRVSYGVYLWHVAVIGGAKTLLPALATRPGMLFVIGLPLSVLMAGLSYRFFEQPVIVAARNWYGSNASRRTVKVVRDRAA